VVVETLVYLPFNHVIEQITCGSLLNEKSSSGFQVSQDCIILLFWCNALRKCMIEPMLIYCSFSPQALNGTNMDNLPVSGRSHKKMWVGREGVIDGLI
jgi:hypothetical protein